MKLFIKCVICFLLLSLNNLHAQAADLNLEDLKAPSMPSASIIGTQVNEVSKPKSLKALEAAIFANYIDSEQSLTIPNNYALEFNPFMLSGRKNFNYEKYLENEVTSNMWRNLSFSVSSTNDFIINDSVSSNAMGFGLRTLILNGEPNEEIGTAYKKALATNQLMLDIKSNVIALISAFLNSTDSSSFSLDGLRSFVLQEIEKDFEKQKKDLNGNALTVHILNSSQTKTVINSIFDELDAKTSHENIIIEFEAKYNKNVADDALKQLRNTLDKIKNNRFGFRWEFDLAMALSFPTNEFNNSVSPRWGFWTNISYQCQNVEELIFVGFARFIQNNDDYIAKYNPVDESFNAGNIYDFGFRFIYEYEKLSVELEYIHRVNSNKIIKIIDGDEYQRTVNNDTNKYLLNLNYNVADNINISYSLGQNFDGLSDSRGNLISGLSINFGFGDISADELLSN